MPSITANAAASPPLLMPPELGFARPPSPHPCVKALKRWEKICMAASHRQDQANIIKFCTFYSLPPTRLILHSSSVLSLSPSPLTAPRSLTLSLQGAEVHAKLWDDTLHSSPRLRVPLALETVNEGEREQLAEHLTGQGLFLAWCECITKFFWFFFAPSFSFSQPTSFFFLFCFFLVVVMCSVAVMASEKKSEFPSEITWESCKIWRVFKSSVFYFSV